MNNDLNFHTKWKEFFNSPLINFLFWLNYSNSLEKKITGKFLLVCFVPKKSFLFLSNIFCTTIKPKFILFKHYISFKEVICCLHFQKYSIYSKYSSNFQVFCNCALNEELFICRLINFSHSSLYWK